MHQDVSNDCVDIIACLEQIRRRFHCNAHPSLGFGTLIYSPVRNNFPTTALYAMYLANGCSVDRWDREVGSFNLPHLDGFKPLVWLLPISMAIVCLHSSFRHVLFEENCVLFQIFVFETSANLIHMQFWQQQYCVKHSLFVTHCKTLYNFLLCVQQLQTVCMRALALSFLSTHTYALPPLLLRTTALLPTPPQRTADSPCKWSDTPPSPHCNRLKGIRHSDLFSCQSRESLPLLRGPMCHQHHQDSPSSAAEQTTKKHCTFLLHCNSVAVLLSGKCTMTWQATCTLSLTFNQFRDLFAIS